MTKGKTIKEWLIAALLVASGVLFAAAFAFPNPVADTDSAARHVGRRLEKRLALLESYVYSPEVDLPDDMVIYRYESDSLKEWRNQFIVMDDDITSRTMVQRMSYLRWNGQSPLSDVGDSFRFYNFGPRWYLLRRIDEGTTTYLLGLEVQNDLDTRIFNGVNKRLRLPLRYSVKPLSSTGGTAVCVGDTPLFKVSYETLAPDSPANATLLWAAVILFLFSCVLNVLVRRTLRSCVCSMAGVIAALLSIYLWGRSALEDFTLFSPTLYAGGHYLYSLGALIVVNLAIMLSVLGFYLVRADICQRVRSRVAMMACSLIDVTAIVLIIVFAHNSLESIVMDSSICLELYKLDELSPYTAIVYLSFITLLMSVPLLLQLLQPASSRFFGRHYNILSRGGRIIAAALIAVFMVHVTTSFGFKKESQKTMLVANRLSVDRDISLELRLIMAENLIAGDGAVSALASIPGSERLLENLISENYLRMVSQDYGVSVRLLYDANPDAIVLSRMSACLRDGVPIENGSRFLYMERNDGKVVYDGVFLFFSEMSGLVRMLVEVTPKSDSGDIGYHALLGMSPPGKVSMPSMYSYARYDNNDLRTFRGKYPYPTKLTDKLSKTVYESNDGYVVIDGYMHFISRIGDGEAVVISRPKIQFVNYAIESAFVAIVAYIILSCIVVNRRKRKLFASSYFKPRIAWVLTLSLILTLVTMASVSVIFVYNNNEDNLRTTMSDRINSVQSLVMEGVRQTSLSENAAEVAAVLKNVSDNTGMAITLYDEAGRVRLSTMPEVYDRMLLGCRMDAEAYKMLVDGNKRYYVHREKLMQNNYFCMYAPLTRSDGSLGGVIGVPYTEDKDFEKDAVMHLVAIVTLFIILFMLARFMTIAVIDRMFKPLIGMSYRMRNADLSNLQYIEYDREDEIQTLVKAYNVMVSELSENSKVLAQAERDKAWSAMARQVAHEIKNPLTPMKLQIQRLIRLKERNSPNWQERFDEVADILLHQIDILSDTASQFSNFAKLYGEEHVLMDVDALLQEEIALYDNRDGIDIDYFGFPEAWIMCPRPQLTRVFWNLLSNACQALEGKENAHIVVSLRNSARSGYFDIVFEDNGPGVSEENIDKLFTPNFTTKSGGSGLGLAMSRRILGECGAEICYSRSFALGGACFTICYPKQNGGIS